MASDKPQMQLNLNRHNIRLPDIEEGVIVDTPRTYCQEPGQIDYFGSQRANSLPSNSTQPANDDRFAERFHEAGAAMGIFHPKPRRHIGVLESLKAIALSSALNAFVIFIPFAWASRFTESWDDHQGMTLILCFLALIPLEHFFDWGGEQVALYCGTDLGDLIVITLNNIVEATLAIILLVKCELKILQSTIIGVVVLHLLFIPGTAFITGGARIMHQALHEDSSELNHTLLMIGVMSLLLPAAFFSALGQGVPSQIVTKSTTIGQLVDDHTRGHFLVISRGVAVILLVLYVTSRVYLHRPPPPVPNASPRPQQKRLSTKSRSMSSCGLEELEDEPKANPWVLLVSLAICIGIMAGTTEWLVESVEVVREQGTLTEEFFGMIVLPLLSFAANAAVAVIYFCRAIYRFFQSAPAPPPAELAHARAIDLSIQFTLFWMPFFVLLAWWIGRPLTLLFDFFEIAVLLGSCFIVNYVTADAKTNWAEGMAMVLFYFMIGLCVWFYTGQPEIQIMLGCDSVATNIVKFTNGTLHGAGYGSGNGSGH